MKIAIIRVEFDRRARGEPTLLRSPLVIGGNAVGLEMAQRQTPAAYI